MAFCKKCGQQYPDTSSFCPNCGERNDVPAGNPYQPQGYNQNMTDPGKGMAVGALVCGIVACVLAWFSMINIVALILGVVGLILGSKARKLSMQVGAPTGIATAGLVLAIIGTVLAAIGFLTCTICVLCVASTTPVYYW